MMSANSVLQPLDVIASVSILRALPEDQSQVIEGHQMRLSAKRSISGSVVERVLLGAEKDIVAKPKYVYLDSGVPVKLRYTQLSLAQEATRPSRKRLRQPEIPMWDRPGAAGGP